MTTTTDILQSNVKLTPMMAQYFEIKKNYPDTIVLYRMGDFYELFFEDAKKAANLLNIALTHRGKLGDFPIPMAGIPHHAANTYIDRITQRGLKAVICEQVEDPKLAQGIVKRAVTQIVSPGMPFDLEKAQNLEHKYIAAAFFQNDHYALILLDFTTGDFQGFIFSDEADFVEKISLYAPKEFLTYKGQWDQSEKISHFIKTQNWLVTNLHEEYFKVKETALYLSKFVPHYERDQVLKKHTVAIPAMGALSYYVCSTQSLEELYHIRPFKLINNLNVMQASLATLMSLEIMPRHRDSLSDSLLGFFDKTKTAMGARKLKLDFTEPSTDLEIILEKQNCTKNWIVELDSLKKVRELLEDIRDLERILAKLSTKKINAQDLHHLSLAIETYFELLKFLPKKVQSYLPLLKNKTEVELKKISAEIVRNINLELGASLEKGNLINEGASKERDRLARLSLKANEELVKLETKYREKTGINNLKIRYNNVSGYFIEVSKSHLSKVPKSFERKQTLVNSERYSTDELIEFEKEVLSAQTKLLNLEREIFNNILLLISENALHVQDLAYTLACVDVRQSFAWMALQENLVCPEIVSEEKVLEVKGAFHPLIKSIIKDEFVTHDLSLNKDKYFGLITGPNMAGKTTVMREMAIIQFLAQLGSFVPASSAKLGLCDAIYSRLGASDDILRGQSTFMVEMTETAEILRHATEKSLIIIDEIGRGTSTYDGLSIAWALVEYFHDKTKSLILFSTHYHELIELVSKLKAAKNLTVETIYEKGQVQFLYRLIEAGATQSFGIHVAKLAGLPRIVLERSGQILKELENQEAIENKTVNEAQLSFPLEEENFKELKKSIGMIDINNMTPIQAMQKLQELQSML